MQRTKNKRKQNLILCKCGCANPVKTGNMFILGHHRRGVCFSEELRKRLSDNKKKYYNKPILKSKLCYCGCMRWTKPGNSYIQGHNQKNVSPSIETRQKIRIRKLGKSYPIEARKRISQTLKEFYSDITKHPRWKGGMSFELYTKEFNNELKYVIREYYGFTCQICGKSEQILKEKLSIHHIDYVKKNNNPLNLIPLCRKCHMKTNEHRGYWKFLMSHLMQRTKQDYTKAILVGDLHLRDSSPICRTDNFIDAQIKKLQFLKSLQKEHQCPVIIPGDIFDQWKTSPYLLSLAMDNLPENLWVVAGNHDLPQHSLDLIDKSGLYTLVTSGHIRLLKGTHYGQEPVGPSLILGDKKILVWHRMIYITPPYPGATGGQAEGVLRKYPQFDLIISGDNHQAFTDSYKGRLLVNPGSFTRQTADQIDFKPRVYLWYADTNTVEPYFLPFTEGAISREHIEQTEQRDARIDAFISRLDGDWNATMSFEENLEAFAKTNNINPKVMEIVNKAIA